MSRKNKFAYYITLISLFFGIAIFGIILSNENIIRAAEEEVNTYTISSVSDFVTYITNYNVGNRNPRDTLNVSFSSGVGFDLNNDSGFESLGTEERPFAGEINFANTSTSELILYNKPLFNYVSTDLQLTGLELIIRRKYVSGNSADTSLFANHVVAGSSSANWNLTMSSSSDSSNATYSSVIGEIDANASVTLRYTDNSSTDIAGSGNVGYIAGTMNASSSLTVTLAGSSSGRTVSSTGGHTGGIVGSMATGANLTITNTTNSHISTVTTSGAEKYAGGIVGKCLGTVTDPAPTYTVGVSTVSATADTSCCAGGLFGYYYSVTAYTFDCAKYPITGIKVVTPGNAGGVFGKLESNNNVTITTASGDRKTITSTLNGNGVGRGGIIGDYINNALSNTLTITNVNTNITFSFNQNAKAVGGLIGRLSHANMAAYISISNVIITTKSTNELNNDSLDGGLIGDAGTAGSFIDVSGTVKVEGRWNAGLVANLQYGVLRLQGTTDFSSLISNNITQQGQIVFKRGYSLVYALGDGNGTGWTLKRNTAQDRPSGNYDKNAYFNVDDIRTWGQVLRVDGSILTEGNLFTVDSTNHIVTIKQPTYSSSKYTIANITDFAKLALNCQLNVNEAVKGALAFESSTRSSSILSRKFELTSNINLAGTGLTGFTRDDDVGSSYRGTFTGNGNTIYLATGEVYGTDSSGTALVDVNNGMGGTSKMGYIDNHTYNGLFAELGNDATISNLKVAGYINFSQGTSEIRIGVIAARATKTVTLENCEVTTTINYTYGNDGRCYIGGAIGSTGNKDNDTNITIDGGVYNLAVIQNSVNVTDNDSVAINIGGVIGVVNENGQTITFTNTTKIGTKFSRTNESESTIDLKTNFGGLIANVWSGNKKTINVDAKINGLDASIIARNRNSLFLSLLGTNWFDSDVTISKLDITDATLTANAGSTNKLYVGGLVYAGTGHWDVTGITITKFDINLANNAISFGFIANKAYDSATNHTMYLDLDNTGSNYDISALSFNTGVTFNDDRYDEIVASSMLVSGIENNGQGIISVTTTDGGLIDTSSCNTYLNKTTYGKTNHSINVQTRYYYNLKSIRKGTSPYTNANANNLMLWSVKTYANSYIESYFVPPSTTFTGNLDMSGYSYYPVNVGDALPVDVGDALTFNNVTNLRFINKEIEDIVVTESGGSTKRTTLANTSQHYLMHASLFLNCNYNLTISNMTISGNVPLIDGASGFLVRGTMGGSNVQNISVNISGLKLGYEASEKYYNAVILNGRNALTDTTYAPLIINGIGSFVDFRISGVSQPGYGTSFSNYAASSLIGGVGSNTAQRIILVFSDMRLDSRITNSTASGLTTFYDTSKSIFSRATFLDYFMYELDGSAEYNFTIAEDWTSKTNPVALHHVTYGSEISESVEYLNRQRQYSPVNGADKPRWYVDCASVNGDEKTDSDFTDFRPYVYDEWDNGELKDKYHEIAVNISIDGILIEGCGKYGDPYIVSDGSQLEMIAVILSGVSISKTYQINLPSSLDYSTACSYVNDYIYQYDGTQFVSINAPSEKTISLENTRKYLAGAYIKITTDISLSSDFIGLGAPKDSGDPYASTYICPYAFRGVIVGVDCYYKKEENGEWVDDETSELHAPIITNNSDNPLIYSSNGSVVKNITIEIPKKTITYALPGTTKDAQLIKYQTGIYTYGGVIGRVMSGDTIIDDVDVQYVSITFNPQYNYAQKRLVPIGGYIGAILSGGVIFRNMTNTSGLTSECSLISESGYLYVNPFIGRVINGYAYYETDKYHYTEEDSTLKNGQKNYSIPDILLPTANNNSDKIQLDYSNSTKTMTIPDGQSFYILSNIINLGAASGSTYANITTEPWVAYREYGVSRGFATYESLGSYAAEDCGKANGETANYAARTRTPYLISKFTYTDNDNFSAKKLATYTDINIELVQGNTYNLPEGYRGIGNIYYYQPEASNVFILRVKSFNGNGCTINNNMRYLEYDQYNGGNKSCGAKAYIAATIKPDGSSKINSNQGTNGIATSGLGLFNILSHKATLNNYSVSSNNKIGNVILGGSIFYDVYNISNGDPSQYKWSVSSHDGVRIYSDKNDYTYLSVGGFAGYSQDMFYIEDITFNELRIESAHGAGGIIGYVGGQYDNNKKQCIESTISFTNNSISIGDIEIKCGVYGGGLIGRIEIAVVTINASSTATIYPNIYSKSQGWYDAGENNWAGNVYSGLGGLIGTVRTFNNKKADNHPIFSYTNGNIVQSSDYGTITKYQMEPLIINNIIISGSKGNAISSYISGVNNSNFSYEIKQYTDAQSSNESGPIGTYVGGVIGSALRVCATISNVTVEDINLTGTAVGGIIGYTTQNDAVILNDVLVDGKNKSINGCSFAGGLIGKVQARDAYMHVFDRVIVKNYNITSSTTDSINAGSGGLIGFIIHSNLGEIDTSGNLAGRPLLVRNVSVINCTITLNSTGGDQAGTGGMIGGVYTISGKHKAFGYNILLDSLTFVTTNNNTYKKGEVIGNNTSSSIFKFVGVSLQDSKDNKVWTNIIGNKDNSNLNNFGTDGYIIFADYDGINNNHAFSTVNATNNISIIYTSGENAYDDPWLLTNPSLALDGMTLTGDGVSDVAIIPNEDTDYSGEVLPNVLYEILSDGNKGKYQYSASVSDVFTAMETYAGKGANTSKFAMFKSLSGAEYDGTDFVVLSLDSTSGVNDIINSYIKLLTNTKLDYKAANANVYTDYKAANANVYTVNILNVTYNGSTFTYTNSGASLQYNNTDGFFFEKKDYDSGKAQFSLIDVQFKDPYNTSKVAYHLYIPVVVKKIIMFDFNIAATSGTTYLPAEDSQFGKALMENTGTPFTLYMEYVYGSETNANLRDEDEWLDALNNGEVLARNYAKYLNFAPVNNNLADLPNSTILVLVDPNNKDAVYYAYYNEAFTDGLLDFTKFRTILSHSNAPSGTAFSTVNLDSIFGITVTQDNTNGTLATTNTNGDDYLFKDSNGTKYILATDETEKYKVTAVSNFIEKYYLTVLTTTGNVLYHHVVSSEVDLAGPPLARILDSNATNAAEHLILGPIFKQDNMSLATTSKTGADLMSPINNEINSTISVDVGLNSAVLGTYTDEIVTYLQNIEVYHHFNINLTRTFNEETENVIDGEPDLSGTYTIDGENSTAYTNKNINTMYAELITGNISETLRGTKENAVTIAASVKLSYTSYAVSLQFPTHEHSNDDGVTVSAISNISFGSSNSISNKSALTASDGNSRNYYSEGEMSHPKLYLGVIGSREGDYNPLGINPLNLENGATSYEFTLRGVLDLTAIYEKLDASSYDKVKVTITLQQKDGVSYSSNLVLKTYLNSINGVAMSADATSYSFSFTPTEVIPSSEIMLPDLTFNVITGAPFETAGLKYSNYKVNVAVELTKHNDSTDEDDPVANSSANNFIIYTHAKVLLNFIDRPQQQAEMQQGD